MPRIQQLSAAPSLQDDQDGQNLPFTQLRLLFSDPTQERYEAARPLLLNQPTTAAQRARETQLHPHTIRRYVRWFEREGMRGLFDEREVIERGRSIPEIVQHEVVRLKTLYAPLHYREIATIIYAKMGVRIDYKSVQSILRQHPIASQPYLPFSNLPFTRFHDHKNPYEARVEVIKLYYHGWNVKSISGFLGLSRQHIYRLLARFEVCICGR